jgi:hypothetical protein
MPEDPVKQVMINNRLIGIVGLEKAISGAMTICADKSDEEISDQNYIPSSARDAYAKALLRQYKIEQNIPVTPEPATGLRIYVLGLGCALLSDRRRHSRSFI